MSFKRYLILTIVLLVRISLGCTRSGIDIHTCSVLLPSSVVPKITHYSETYNVYLKSFRKAIAPKVYAHLGRPHGQLLLGMVLGMDELYKVYYFRQRLQITGTLHVVVVSGYNISLVLSVLLVTFGKSISFSKLLLLLVLTLMYALLTGFEPPVIRAWVMTGFILLAKSLGRPINQLDVLVLSGGVILLVSPILIKSLSFQLSFLATFSLIYYSRYLDAILKPKNLLYRDLITTISAQILVWPLIAYRFNQVSLLSPLVNALVLWTVPMATILGSVFVIVALINATVAEVVAIVVYIPLEIFVFVINLFSEITFTSLPLTLKFKYLAIYYFVVLFVPIFIAATRKR